MNEQPTENMPTPPESSSSSLPIEIVILGLDDTQPLRIMLGQILKTFSTAVQVVLPDKFIITTEVFSLSRDMFAKLEEPEILAKIAPNGSHFIASLDYQLDPDDQYELTVAGETTVKQMTGASVARRLKSDSRFLKCHVICNSATPPSIEQEEDSRTCEHDPDLIYPIGTCVLPKKNDCKSLYNILINLMKHIAGPEIWDSSIEKKLKKQLRIKKQHRTDSSSSAPPSAAPPAAAPTAANPPKAHHHHHHSSPKPFGQIDKTIEQEQDIDKSDDDDNSSKFVPGYDPCSSPTHSTSSLTSSVRSSLTNASSHPRKPMLELNAPLPPADPSSLLHTSSMGSARELLPKNPQVSPSPQSTPLQVSTNPDTEQDSPLLIGSEGISPMPHPIVEISFGQSSDGLHQDSDHPHELPMHLSEADHLANHETPNSFTHLDAPSLLSPSPKALSSAPATQNSENVPLPTSLFFVPQPERSSRHRDHQCCCLSFMSFISKCFSCK